MKISNKSAAISNQFLQLGITDFIQACEYVKNLPYKEILTNKTQSAFLPMEAEPAAPNTLY